MSNLLGACVLKVLGACVANVHRACAANVLGACVAVEVDYYPVCTTILCGCLCKLSTYVDSGIVLSTLSIIQFAVKGPTGMCGGTTCWGSNGFC